MTDTVKTPNLFVIGVQKCGTTLLCQHLMQHNSVLHSKPKEPFDLLREVDNVKFKKYIENRFLRSKSYQSITYMADGSSTYFQSKRALKNIQIYCSPDAKVIVSLRHPVYRAISHYFHDIKRGRGHTRGSILDQYYLEKSTYSTHLNRWLDWCGADRLLVLRYDDLQSNPVLFVKSAFDFLGLNAIPTDISKAVNVGWKPYVDGNLIRVKENLDYTVKVSDLARMQDILKQDIEETGRITGWDVSSWLEPISPSSCFGTG